MWRTETGGYYMSYYMLLEFYKFGDMGIKKKKREEKEICPLNH